MTELSFDQFLPYVNRLAKVYGDKAFPRERAEILYRAFRYTREDVLQATVDEVIGEHMHAPSITKIREAMYLVRKRFGDNADRWQPIRDAIREREKTSSCGLCFGSGILMAHRRDDPRQYLLYFLCSCSSGELAIQLPEYNGKTHQWDELVARDWKHHFESDTPPTGTRTQAREVARLAIRNTDLNKAIGLKEAPRKPYKDDNWDEDL